MQKNKTLAWRAELMYLVFTHTPGESYHISNKKHDTKNKTSAWRVELMYLVFTRTPGESYRRQLWSLLLCLCGIFQTWMPCLLIQLDDDINSVDFNFFFLFLFWWAILWSDVIFWGSVAKQTNKQNCNLTAFLVFQNIQLSCILRKKEEKKECHLIHSKTCVYDEFICWSIVLIIEYNGVPD